jgi:hypothetical protein
MTQEHSPYDAVIADLEAKRDQMTAMIENLKQMRGLANSVVVAGVSVHPAVGTSATLSHDAFFGMSLPDAARKYLSIVKKTVPHPQFCDALLDGGFKTSATNFREVVRSALSRHPDFVKVNGQWGLSEWYGKRGKKTKSADSSADQRTDNATDSENDNKKEENSAVIPAAKFAV